MDPTRRAILRRVRAFAELEDAECDVVLALLKARRGAPGDTLFREGDRGDSLMIVLDGELVAHVGSELVARLGPGEVVGEMAFASAEPRSATVSSPAGATVLEFTREALSALYRSAPRVAASIQRNVLLDVARRLRDVGVKLTDAASGPISRRASSAESSGRGARSLTVEQLRAVSALAGYPLEDLELLAHIATLRTFAAGEVLMREGAAGDACWLLVSGELAVTRADHVAPIATLAPGALVGQLALLDRAPRSATVTATRDAAALEIHASAFRNLVRASSPIALRFQAQVMLAGVRQLRAATKQYAEAARIKAASPMSMRMLDVDDWDDAGGSETLELAFDPASRR